MTVHETPTRGDAVVDLYIFNKTCERYKEQIMQISSQRDDYHRKACEIADERDQLRTENAQMREEIAELKGKLAASQFEEKMAQDSLAALDVALRGAELELEYLKKGM